MKLFGKLLPYLLLFAITITNLKCEADGQNGQYWEIDYNFSYF